MRENLIKGGKMYTEQIWRNGGLERKMKTQERRTGGNHEKEASSTTD